MYYSYITNTCKYILTVCFPGVATLLAVNILAIPLLGLANLARVLEWVFLTILPHYCLAQGLMDYYSNYEYLGICPLIEEVCKVGFPNPCCTCKSTTV